MQAGGHGADRPRFKPIGAAERRRSAFSGLPQRFLRTLRRFSPTVRAMKAVRELLVPAAVMLLLAEPGPAHAQSREFNLSCEPDEVLVGVSGRQGWWMDGIAARCRS